MRQIVLFKSYVKGHFEKRNGRLFYVRPYENNKSKHHPISTIADAGIVNGGGFNRKLPYKKDDGGKHPKHLINVDPHQEHEINYIVEFALELAYTIHGFDDGEIVKLENILKYCKSILIYYKYMDDNVKYLFKVPSAEPKNLDTGDVRLIRARRREAEKIFLRATGSKIKRTLKDIIDVIHKIA